MLHNDKQSKAILNKSTKDYGSFGQYSDSGAHSNQTAISEEMDQVEGDEITSASQSVGGRPDTLVQQSRNARAQQPVRMISNKLIMLNVLANFLMFAITGFITYHCFNKATVLFSWHPTFMCIGYFILMSQAILTLSGANLLTYKRHYKTRIYVHWILQTVAVVLITIAFVCIFLNKVRMNKAHFQTTHAIFGIITIILSSISICGGVFSKYGFQLRQLVRPIYSKIGHAIVGTVTYVLSTTTIALGIYSKWFQEDNNGQVRMALLVGIIAVALYVIINPIAATISRVKSAIRTTL
ncbi:probable transmembrane reductase CYB561D1 isoform X2 [Malaya genurostris]|uniref:probable transmembrane reductase CYB561D1 isoform X2 n=1 Tax=Malaya genurostris TaxID=325434 RepID=UPI0026F3A864|nr:probable transmembrane reductase CYB561D1 isoform X2 [Malaya genurostris]